MTEQEIYQSAINKFGTISQLEMLQEEATELALATRRMIRKPSTKHEIELYNEVADTLIMIEQLKLMLSGAYEEIKKAKQFKLKRLEEIINE